MEKLDYQSQFERMKADVVAAFTKALDIRAKGTKRRLVVKNVWVDDNQDSSDWESQREAVRKDSLWGVPVYAELELVTDDGKVLSKTKKMRVATLPKSTNFGSFIVNGKHYQVHSQFRRKPGVYVREKKNRDLATEYNIPGRPFAIEFDRKKSNFKMVAVGGGGSLTLPLYPLLSRLGVSDSAMEKAWGADVLAENKAVSDKIATSSLIRAAKRFAGDEVETAEEAVASLRDYFANTELRPEVTKLTLGKEFKSVTPESLLQGATELLKVNRGERKPDDRQALEFKKAYSMADLLRERMIKPNGELGPKLADMRRKIYFRMKSRKAPPTRIDRVVHTNELTPFFTSFFTQSELSSTPDQINPIDMVNGMSKVTIMGEGGVSDEQLIDVEERAIHPSHLGFLDPIHTPDSSRIGATTNLPLGVQKKGEDLQTRVIDPKTKKLSFMSPIEMRGKRVAFPDQYKGGKFVDKKVKAVVDGEVRLIDANTVDAVLASPKQAFSIASNAIPFLPSAHGIRAQMATKMLDQALPVVGKEAPLVQVKMGPNTVESGIGTGFSVRAKAAGTVESVSGNRIIIRTDSGLVEQPIYNNLALNRKSLIHATPRVKAGDVVEEGQLIADSNFTDNGVLAIGTNLKAAYIPYKGYNFEDGIVITETAAKKLTSEHLHRFEAAAEEGSVFSLDDYMAFKRDLTVDQQAKLDKDGVVRKGQVLQKGDPLWVGTRENLYDPDYIAMKRLKPSLSPRKGYKEEWDKDYEGVVTDVVKQGKKVKIFVKTREPAQVGDKLTNRHGGKGIITKIIPDGEAPATADGENVDILLNPHGIVSRMNPSQVLETAAAKAAKATGTVYKVDNFSGENYSQSVLDALKKAGIKETEPLYDPHSKEPLGEVLVGPQFIMKLSKQATSQYSARSDGKYDMNRSPLRGGEDGAKALDLLSFYSMLSHGSRANLREMATFKATQNEPFWQWIAGGAATGLMTPTPEPTFAYRKFEAYMKGAGVNMARKGSKMALGPLTDREVENLSSGKVEKPLFLTAKNLSPEKGGLMDPQIFGNQKDKWGHMDLAEPLPNPVFEDPIRTLTGISKPQFASLIRGTSFIDPETGEWSESGGLTGGNAIKHLLSKVDVDAEMQAATEDAKNAGTSPTKLNAANKRLRYLAALKKNKLRPEDAYMQTKVPIIPPMFREVQVLPDGTLSNPGLNTLYRDVGLINNELQWQKDVPFLPEGMKGELRQNLYDGVKALVGLGQPIAFYPSKRKPKGIIEQLKGDSAKSGFYQYKVLRRQQNLVGRGTIIPEPKLGLDEVGIPEDMAWNLYEKFVTRRLVNLGRAPTDAMEDVEKRTPMARSALEAELADRPVILNRAPSLHKFNMMAFKPRLTHGKAIRIPPLIVKGYNADFDGDTMTVHVPIMPDAVREAENMLPSNNLYNPGTGQIMIKPQNEATLGLYLMGREPEGRKRILKELPAQLQKKYATTVLDKGGLSKMFDDLATVDPKGYANIVDRLKQMGDEHTYKQGFTISMKDIAPPLEARDQIFKRINSDLRKINFDDPKQKEKARALVAKANEELDGLLDKQLKGTGNSLYQMVESGARGNRNQLKQTVSAPFMVNDYQGNISPVPVMKSFGEGLDFSDYWQTAYGARSVAIDKQLQTQKPGAFSKDIMATAITEVIAKDDCGTRKGVTLPISKRHDLEGRFLLDPIRAKDTVIARAGSPVTPGLLNSLSEHKVNSVVVRSPLTCALPKGVCAKCYGLTDEGGLPSVGDNVGAISGQAMSEPIMQMTLRTFHSGGLAGTRGIISGYEKIDKLLKMPQMKRGRATLAQANGVVESIEDAPGQTGKNVKISGAKEPHYIPQLMWDPSLVRVGATVKKGDILSKGLVQPNELADLKGMLPAQEYVTDQLQEAYGSQGVNIKRRAIETVVRAAGNTTRILDPADSPFLPGDVAPWTVVRDLNSQSLGAMKTSDALGYQLDEDVPGLKKRETITPEVQKILDGLGKKTVKVGPRKIRDKPFLSGIEQIPVLREDWMSQMGYQRIADAVIKGSAKGFESDIHGYAPIPAFAYGAEFGQAPGGRSKTEGVY